jgi:hypothetical protein
MKIRNDDQQTLRVTPGWERRARGMPIALVPNKPDLAPHEVMPGDAAV